MDVTGIQQVVANSQLVYPSLEKQHSTSMESSAAFTELLIQSKKDPSTVEKIKNLVALKEIS